MHSRQKHFERYNAKNCNFPFFIKEGRKLFPVKRILIIQGNILVKRNLFIQGNILVKRNLFIQGNICESKIKQDITKIMWRTFYEVNLPVEFDREKYNLQSLIFFKPNLWYNINLYKYPSQSINKIKNYKPIWKIPDKCEI